MVLRGMMIVWENEDFLTKSHDGNSRKSMMLNKKITGINIIRLRNLGIFFI